jgi:hypothetical protein
LVDAAVQRHDVSLARHLLQSGRAHAMPPEVEEAAQPLRGLVDR